MAQLIVNFGPDVAQYLRESKQTACPRPAQCPKCGARASLKGHGYYPRKPRGLGADFRLWVKRWRCKACGRTTSCLPCFLLPFRQYILVFIQWVLMARFAQGQSWSQVFQRTAPGESLHLRTIQRWCRSFAARAAAWLLAIQTTLAQQHSTSVWLDAHGEAVLPPAAAPALLVATEHWLAWAQTQWPELAPYGLANRLCAVWLWGAPRPLPRRA
jgi:uncharacterized protein DUF6431